MRLEGSPRLTSYLNATKAPHLKCPQPWLLCFRGLLKHAEWLPLPGHHLRETPAGLLVVNSLSVAYNNCFLSQKPQVFIVSPEHLKHACGSPFSIAMGSGPSASPLSSQTRDIPSPMSANIYSAYHKSEETACYKEGRKGNKKQEPGTMQNQKSYSEYLRTGKRWSSERIWLLDDW